MAGPLFFDRVKDTTTTTGTGTVTLANSAPTGYRTLGSVLADGDTCFYCIAGQSSTEWEVGLGTYDTTGPVLARTLVLKSSNSNNAVNFSAGTKDVFINLPADVMQSLSPPLWNGVGSLSCGGYPVPNAKWVEYRGTSVGAGNVDCYTVPTGKIAVINNPLLVYNGSGGNSSAYGSAYVDGSYLKYTTATDQYSAWADNTTTSVFLSGGTAIPLSAGEKAGFYAGDAGVSCIGKVLEFDVDKIINISTYITSGNNTVYTCPSGKTAVPFNIVSPFNMSYTFGLQNGGGSSITITSYAVKSGDSPQGKNRLSTPLVISAPFAGSISPNVVFSAGDYIVINSDSGDAGQYFFGLVLEVPSP